MRILLDDGEAIPLEQDSTNPERWSDSSGYTYRVWGNTAIRLYEGLDTAWEFPIDPDS